MRLWVGVLASAFLLVCPRAHAADWTKVFPPQAVSSHLPTLEDSVMVVAADGAPGTRAAADALESGFRSGGRARLVLSDAAIRESAPAEDSAIVSRCAGMPVTVIAVVRLLDGASGQHAIVTLYSRSGKTIGAFSGSAGTPVVASDRSTDVGAGVSADAAAAVARAAQTAQTTQDVAIAMPDSSAEPRTDAEKQFLSSFLWVGDSYLAPVRGRYEERISWSRFYYEVGGKELRYRYNRNRVLKVTGVVLAPAVLYLALAQPWQDGILEYDDSATRTVGWSLVGVSFGMCMAGYHISPHPVPLSEAKKLADEYNRALKERLGLASAQDEQPEPVMLFGVGPRKDGGVLALALRF